jgi:hypothetical protein
VSALEDRARQIMAVAVGMKMELDEDLEIQLDAEDLLGQRHLLLCDSVEALPQAMRIVRQLHPTLVAFMADAHVRLHQNVEQLRSYQRGEIAADPTSGEALVVHVLDARTFDCATAVVVYGRHDDGALHFEEIEITDDAPGRVVRMMREGLL